MSTRVSTYCILTLFLILSYALPLNGQTVIEGKVLDSSSRPISGIDVAIYVAGNKDPVASTTSGASGIYSFRLGITAPFDIAYTHSMYEMSIVPRLAQQDAEHISKVLYRKGEPQSASAFDDHLITMRRFVFLATAIAEQNDRKSFMEQFTRFEVFSGLNANNMQIQGPITHELQSLFQRELSQLSQEAKLLLSK